MLIRPSLVEILTCSISQGKIVSELLHPHSYSDCKDDYQTIQYCLIARLSRGKLPQFKGSGHCLPSFGLEPKLPASARKVCSVYKVAQIRYSEALHYALTSSWLGQVYVPELIEKRFSIASNQQQSKSGLPDPVLDIPISQSI